MTSLTLMPPSGEGLQLGDRKRRNSYFEALSVVSSDLNLVAADLKKAQAQFKASSPKSPLAASTTVPVIIPHGVPTLEPPPADRYRQVRLSRNYSLGTNNNASTVSTMPPVQYTQLHVHVPAQRGGNTAGLPASFESLFLPTSPLSHRGSSHEGLVNPHLLPGHHGDDTMELSPLTRLVHTKPIWFLPNTQRTAAIHYLQGQPVGTFVVCQARDKDNLVLTMKHPGNGTGLYIEKLPILISPNGMKLSSATGEFSTIEDLVLHHLYHEGVLPCKLTLPPEIMAARNVRALQSLAILEEEFWVRNRSRPGASDKQVEEEKQAPGFPGSPRSWATLPLTSAEQQQHFKPTPMLPSLAPSLPSPKGYMVMNKQPVFAPQKGRGMPLVSLRNVGSVVAENRRLHKSWSFDDKNNPFRQSEFLSMIPGKDGQAESLDDTLLARTGRQPMRFSTQSQQEFLLQNLGHYPPPLHSPPPPPPPPKDTLHTGRPPQSPVAPPLVHRSSAEYYTPFESTRQGHQPPTAFGFESVSPYQMPPPLPSHSISHPLMGTHYHQPVANSSLPAQFAQYSSPHSLIRPQGSAVDSSKLKAQLASLKGTSWSEKQTKPTLQQKPTFGSIVDQQTLAPVLQPSVSATPPLSVEQTVNPLFEFDPLHTVSQPKETPLSSTPLHSQDVFSDPPQPVQADPQSSQLPLSRYEATVGQLLNFVLDSSDNEEEETGEPKSPDKTGGTDCSSEDWDQTGEDDDEDEEEDEGEGDRTREDHSSSAADTQSSHSSEAHSQAGEHPPQNIKTGMVSDEERSVDKLSKITPSQAKKIKKLKKKKKSNLSKLQKYMLKGKRQKKKERDPTKEIQAAIQKLANDKSSYFSMMIECFVQGVRGKCDRERPDVMIRSLRQFMSGLKNYLFNRREPEVDAAMDKYYNLTMAELDAIVEGAIHSYILLPLRSEIYKCFINDHKESGSLEVLDHNIQLARAKTPVELGIKENYTPPEGENLEKIRQYFHHLEDAYSPIKKLEHLLDIVRTVYDTVVDKNSSRCQSVQSMGADDFLPMLIHVLVQCEVVNVEVEADYMWGLLDPAMLSGEGGYYLTTLSSAICVLKQFEQENQHTETKGFLSILVAQADAGDHVVHKTLPVLPGMNAGDVSRILASKMKIDNAHLYKLYLLVGDEEIPIADGECPLEMKENKAGQFRPSFGYKEEDRPIKWFPTPLP